MTSGRGTVDWRFRMKRYLPCLALWMLSILPASAQFNIQTQDGGNVSIGPGGITVNKRNKKIDISPAGINIQKPNKTVEVSPSGVMTSKGKHKNSKELKEEQAAALSGTGSSSVSMNADNLSLDQRVTLIEMHVYGKKSDQPLLHRVEKLERDNFGKKGTGTIVNRIDLLWKDLAPPATPLSGPAQDVIGINSNDSSKSIDSQVLTLNDSNFDGEIKCNNNDAILNASNCKIKFTGTLRKLVVNGSNNEIYCEDIRDVQTNGSSNNVSWNANAKPNIADAGSENKMRAK